MTDTTRMKDFVIEGTILKSYVGDDKDVTIPAGVTSIGRNAFAKNALLRSVHVPNGVTSIDPSAFWKCEALESVDIPSSVESIGACAFEECEKLTKVNIDCLEYYEYFEGGRLEKAYEGVTSIGFRAFACCRGLESITLPMSLESIGDSAFASCAHLKSVEIPKSVTKIGKGAFSSCMGLQSISIPFVGAAPDDTENSYFAYIFIFKQQQRRYNAHRALPSSLKSVTIAGKCSIGKGAFSECADLTSIFFSDGVTSIASTAFSECSGIESLVVDRGNPIYKSENNCVIERGSNKLVIGCKTSVIPSYVTAIGDSAFSGCVGLKSINIPNGVTSIGRDAFACCRGLSAVVIPDSVKTIGDSAFFFCYDYSYHGNLTSVTMPRRLAGFMKGRLRVLFRTEKRRDFRKIRFTFTK